MTVAGVVALVPLLWFHGHAFGSIWRTGYSFTGHSSAFSWDYFATHALYAVKTLSQMPFGVSLFFPLGLVGLGWGLARRRREAMFLMLWCVPGLLLYMAYYWIIVDDSGGWLVSRGTVLYVRLYLTLYPSFVIAGLMVLSGVIGPRFWRGIVVAAGVVLLGIVQFYLTPEAWWQYEGTAVSDQAATQLVRGHLRPDAVIVADGYAAYSLVYYTDMTVFYPSYFAADWVRRHLEPGDAAAGSPAFWNPLRRERFAAIAGKKSGEELDALFAERLLFYARQGKQVGLVVSSESKPWYQMLEGAFTREVIAEDSKHHVVLFELKPKAGAVVR